MEPVGIEPTSKRPPNQTFITRLLVLSCEAHHWNKNSEGVNCWNQSSRLDQKASRNELLCCHESPDCDLTIPLYFVVLIKADYLRGTSPQQNSVYKKTILSETFYSYFQVGSQAARPREFDFLNRLSNPKRPLNLKPAWIRDLTNLIVCRFRALNSMPIIRLELTTKALQGLRSTIELNRHNFYYFFNSIHQIKTFVNKN